MKNAGVYFSILLIAAVALISGCSRERVAANDPSTRSGATASAQDRSNEVRISPSNSDPAEPGITADADGTLYVVYVEHAADKSADLYLQKIDSNLHQKGDRIRINPEPGIVKTWAGDPPTIKIAPDRSIVVGWTARSGGGTDYVISVSHDGGSTFSSPTKINDDVAPASHGMHSFAVGSDGTIYAAWLDERNIVRAHETAETVRSDENSGFHFVRVDHKGPESAEAPEPNSEVFFAFSKDGGKTFSKNQRLATDVCPCCKTAITTDEGGHVYVSWRQVLDGDFRHIAVASSSDGGQTFSPRSIVSDDRWHIMACPVSGAALGADGSNLDVVWYTAGSEGQAGYYISRSTDGGTKFGPRMFISGDAATGKPAILKTVSDTTIVYQGADNKAVIATAGQQSNFVTASTIESANNPVAVLANGATYVAFVRNENKTRSIWIAKR